MWRGFNPELKIDPVTGEILGTPTNDAVGDCSITVFAEVNVREKVGSTPNLRIPDEGDFVSDSITINGNYPTVSEDFEVEINVDHSWIGDLEIVLVSPEGIEVILHNKTGGDSNDIVGTYPTTLSPAEPRKPHRHSYCWHLDFEGQRPF